MTNQFNATKIIPTGELADVIAGILDPLVHTLDSSDYQPDDGKKHSATDWGMKIALGKIITSLYAANYQEGTSAAGKVYQSNNQKRLASNEDVSALTEEDLETMKGASTFHWQAINQARCEVTDHLIEEFRIVYKGITGEEWAPMVYANKTQPAPVQVSDDVKAQMRARMAAIKPKPQFAVGSST